jgi:methylphosphotriester-DNA--protein-cysteine methyltransferase
MKKRHVLKVLLAVACVSATTVLAANSSMVKGNPDSKIYHKSTCKHYAAKGSTSEFTSEAEAVKAGYKGCKKCSGTKKKSEQK